MPHIPYHPAPGFGDLLPGSFVVPQNPLRGPSTALVPSVQAAAGGNVAYRPKIGDLLPGAFPVPFNPIRSAMAISATGVPMHIASATAGLAALGCGGCGCTDSGASGSNFYGMSGLGTTDPPTDTLSSITAMLQSPGPFGLPNWAVYGGAALLAYMLLSPGGSEYRTQAKALRSKYRGYRRAGRALGEAAA